MKLKGRLNYSNDIVVELMTVQGARSIVDVLTLQPANDGYLFLYFSSFKSPKVSNDMLIFPLQ